MWTHIKIITQRNFSIMLVDNISIQNIKKLLEKLNVTSLLWSEDKENREMKTFTREIISSTIIEVLKIHISQMTMGQIQNNTPNYRNNTYHNESENNYNNNTFFNRNQPYRPFRFNNPNNYQNNLSPNFYQHYNYT